jgi:hypothetical protein
MFHTKDKVEMLLLKNSLIACFWFPELETVSVFWKPKEADVLKILHPFKIFFLFFERNFFLSVINQN